MNYGWPTQSASLLSFLFRRRHQHGGGRANLVTSLYRLLEHVHTSLEGTEKERDEAG